ncbi:MAG: hypothetical protein V7761_13330 [Amylibacter sp.]
MKLIIPLILGCVLFFLTGCESASTSASEHSFKDKRYVVVGVTRSGSYGDGSFSVGHRDTVLARDASGNWVKVGEGDLADLIISEGTFIRRLDSTKIKTTPYGGAIIPNAELNKTSASDIQGD